MRQCKHCNDTLFTDCYETCMTCYENHHTELPMKKCPNCETYAKNSETNSETKSNIIGDLRSVLDKTLYELPCSYIPNHTYESIPEQVAYYVKENQSLRTALEEIAKKNRKAETCRLIALKALGELNDEDYQPELLIEENLKLRMQVEDLESKIVKYSIDTVFNPEDVPLKDWEGNPITHCQDCGEYWGYHHEEHCKGKLLDNADKHSKMYP